MNTQNQGQKKHLNPQQQKQNNDREGFQKQPYEGQNTIKGDKQRPYGQTHEEEE